MGKTVQRTLAFILLSLVWLLGAPAVAASGEGAGAFFVGKNQYMAGGEAREMEEAPFVDDNGRTVVPVRFLAYALGIAEEGIHWCDESKSVTLLKDGTTVSLQMGDTALYIDGVLAGRMDTCPILKNGRVFLPARYLAEAFKYSVSWDESLQKIDIGPKGSGQGLKLAPPQSGLAEGAQKAAPGLNRPAPTLQAAPGYNFQRDEMLRRHQEITRMLREEEQRRFWQKLQKEETERQLRQVQEYDRTRKMQEQENLRRQQQLMEEVRRQQDARRYSTPQHTAPAVPRIQPSAPAQPYIPPAPVRPYIPAPYYPR